MGNKTTVEKVEYTTEEVEEINAFVSNIRAKQARGEYLLPIELSVLKDNTTKDSLPTDVNFYEGVEPNDEDINTSGLSIYDDRILVAVKETEKVTAGGIILPDKKVDEEEMAQTYATVISVGRYAFDDMHPDHRPKSGEVIYMAKYAGTLLKGPADGKPYRIVRPVDVLAKVV